MLALKSQSSKKNYKPRKPDSVLGYHLSMLPTRSISGPLTSMWHCSAQGLPFCNIAIAERELLPHIFTLSFRWLFSAALSLFITESHV